MEAFLTINSWNILGTIAILLRGGCESAFVIDSDGIIEVAIRTNGPDRDPDGYRLRVDGRAFEVPTVGSVTLQLPQGSHRLQVDGLAENCSVDGANPRTVTVDATGSTGISIVVVCVRASLGSG